MFRKNPRIPLCELRSTIPFRDLPVHQPSRDAPKPAATRHFGGPSCCCYARVCEWMMRPRRGVIASLIVVDHLTTG